MWPTLVWFCVSAFVLNAQTQTPQQPPPPPNQPIELPEFIVTGKESVNIPGGTKREPVRPPILKADKLDSLNPIEKLPLPKIPAKPLPQYKSDAQYWPGYVEVEFGNYITPSIDAGYSVQADGYLIDIRGGLEASSGWAENADYVKAGVGASSTYIAPEKFLVLGGSTTVVDLDVTHRSYKLFAVANAPSRTTTAIGAGVNTDGEYDNVRYNALIDWKTIGLSTNSLSKSDNAFIGMLELVKQWNTFDVGFNLDLRLRSFGDSSYPYTALSATGKYADTSVTVSARAGAQWATSTSGTDRFGALLEGSAEFRVSPQVTLVAGVSSGLRPNAFRELLQTNPYINDSSMIDASYDLFDVTAIARFHPTVRFTAAVGMDLRATDRDVVWVPAFNGSFAPSYLTTSTVHFFGDMRWMATSTDAVIADAHFTNSTIDEAAQKPYVPSFQASAGYDRSWSEQFRTVATIVYVGDRWADIANSTTLSGYVDVRLAASYLVGKNLHINARADNLFSNSMVLWQGYRERGIFISAGITLTF